LSKKQAAFAIHETDTNSLQYPTPRFEVTSQLLHAAAPIDEIHPSVLLVPFATSSQPTGMMI